MNIRIKFPFLWKGLGIGLLLITLLFSESIFSQKDTWAKRLPGIGTFSSPRITDLNSDGIGDVILGAGRKEFQSSDTAVVAMDGKTGKMLWHVSATDQIFGSATFKDINNDGVNDVFIGGRAAELIAINGKSGAVIWRFIKTESDRKDYFNFYNPQFIPDQNKDGIEDILVSNGGDIKIEAHDPNRRPGFLLILDSTNGEIISKAEMPDGKEIYMSVAVLPQKSPNFKNVIFGTGGETIGGSLFVTSIEDILSEDLSGAVKLDSSANKGFVGPAAWVDINSDRTHDIVANSVDGRLLAFDGKSHESIWKVSIPDTEGYSAVAIGNFTDDDIPDFFVSNAQGVWPKLDWSKQIMVDGSNGLIKYQDSLGFYQMSSPVVVDLNGDNKDEILLPMNYQVTDKYNLKYFYNNLMAIEFTENIAVPLDLKNEGHNLSSTPWVGDIDNNGFLDIIYVHGTNIKQTYTFDGLQINRIDTLFPVVGKTKWGSYMGSSYNGVYNR